MKTTTETRGISLNLKLFLFTAFLISLLVGGILWFSSQRATALAQETVRSQLKETLSVFDTFQKDRYDKLQISNSLVAENPYFQAYITESDSASILDLARQTEEVLKSDFIIVTDSDGTILARTDKPFQSGEDVSEVPLIRHALEGETGTGLWLENQNLYHAISLPVVTGDLITASLAVGYGINNWLAGQIRDLTHSETAFYVPSPTGGWSLSVATISRGEELSRAFSGNVRPEEPIEFQLGPEKYIGIARPLKNLDGKVLGLFVAFRSLDRELYAFHQFQKSVLLTGIGIMILAFLLTFVGTRQITGPLRELTHAMNEVKDGNYDVPIEVKSGGEVGILASSFRKLLAELKEKEHLVDYLSQQPTMVGAGSTFLDTPRPHATSPATPTQTLANLEAGTIIANRYQVLSVLGTGGMGVVLKALDKQLDETVALKMLKGEVFAQNADALDRFKQELKLARRITHRNVVRTYDYSETDNYYIISMEYVKGITLKQLIQQRGMLPLKIGLQIGKQICSALEAAHEKGVLHRDIKPQNILLESTGDVKIMDFGIAKLAEMQGMTLTGTVIGTPDYMSPEQAQGIPLDTRTDIYSTGIVLYEIFTGKLPFAAESPLAVLNMHIRELPPRPSSINPGIPLRLEKILLKTLEKNPLQRYGTISALYTDLDDLSSSIANPSEKIA